MPDNPPKNPSNDLGDQIAEGLVKALGNSRIQDLVSRMVERSESKSDRQSHAGRIRAGYGDLREAERISEERTAAGINPARGQVSANASRGFLAGMRGDAREASHPYYMVPPSFGEFASRPSMQSYAQMVMEKNLQRVENSASGSEEQRMASRGYRRAQFFHNEAIPMAKAAQGFYQNQVKPMYRMVQGAQNVGYGQLGGGAQGDDINMGPFGFRNPFGAPFTKGLGIKFHQFGESLGAGINQQQMEQIDNTLFGQGFQIDEERFRPAEKSLINLARYNPAIDTGLAAQSMEGAFRYGGQDQIDALEASIKSLASTAKSSNVSIQELQQQMIKFQDIAGQTGGLSSTSGPAAAELARRIPGMDPSNVLNTLKNNPFGQQAVMKRGFQSYQVGGMNANQQESAFNETLDATWKQVFGKDMAHTTKAELKSMRGQKAIGSMQGLYGIQLTADDMAGYVGNTTNRRTIQNAEDRLHNILREGAEGGVTHLTADQQKHGLNPKNRTHRGVHHYDKTQITRTQLDSVLREAGIRGKDAEKFIEENDLMEGSMMKEGYAHKLQTGLDKKRTQRGQASVRGIDKAVKAVDDLKSGLEEHKDDLKKGEEAKT